jgi:hypothetical protein
MPVAATMDKENISALLSFSQYSTVYAELEYTDADPWSV